LDYENYDTGDDHNLILYGDNNDINSNEDSNKIPNYSFADVLNGIKRNETMEEISKKFLSAAASLSERSGSSPGFMLWTVPTTLFAALGLFYFVSAAAIVGYQNTLGGGVDLANLAPALVAFAAPAVLAFVAVAARSGLRGQLDVDKVMRGDFK